MPVHYSSTPRWQRDNLSVQYSSTPRRQQDNLSVQYSFTPRRQRDKSFETDTSINNSTSVPAEASTSGSSVQSHEQVLQEALNTMAKRPTGIEDCLSTCEKALRLLLQVALATCNSSQVEQKEEGNVGQLDVSLKKQAREACKAANTPGDAIRSVARILFSSNELLSCSARGRHTNKAVQQRPALDATRLQFLMITKVFPKMESSKINGILGDFLKKNRTRSGRKSDD